MLINADYSRPHEKMLSVSDGVSRNISSTGAVRGLKMDRTSQQNGSDEQRQRQLVRVTPRYVRLRQGSEIRYHVRLTRPPSKGKGVTIHVCVIMNKCGITATPAQLVVTASDWRTPREVIVSSDPDSQLRTIQIHHKIYETYDEVYNACTVIPSLFVSVLQKEATFLFAFGCGRHGRLGTNSEENALVPASFSCKWMHPVQIACGKAHSAIIDVYSNIYCFGLGASGQLGQGDANLEASRIPLRVPAIGAVPVLLVACGSHHTMCMTAEGRIFAWGDNSHGQLGTGSKSSKPRGTPTRVDKLAGVRSIVCGGSHSFIVTQDSSVFASGSNIAGQLGLGDRIDRVSFERVPFFRRLLSTSVSMVIATATAANTSNNTAEGGFSLPDLLLPTEIELACGLYHSLALCGQQVYAWGNGDDGRLGLGNNETALEPTLVSLLQDIPVRSIACGGSHSGAIAMNGDVFTWGNGQYGQLGVGPVRARRVPTKVRLLSDKGVNQLSLGEWHSMALCQDGSLYAWGFGEEGQLGLPGDDSKGFQRELPHSRIALFPMIVHSLSGTGATSVQCGGAHTFVVSVLENRRQHLARLQQRVSRTEVMSESKRLQTRRHTRVLQGPILPPGRSSKKLHQEKEDDDDEPLFQQRPDANPNTRKSPTPARCHSARGASEHEVEVDEAVAHARSFSWRERPMTSRLAVKNAAKRQMQELSSAKERLGEFSSPAPSMPSQRSSRSRTGGRTFVSPRMVRLQQQIERATEAGAARFKCDGFVADGSTADAINAAVDDAARACLLSGNETVKCVPTPERMTRQKAKHAASPQDDAGSLHLQLLLNALTEMDGNICGSEVGDGECSEASSDIPLPAGGRAGCQSLEEDIRRSAFR